MPRHSTTALFGPLIRTSAEREPELTPIEVKLSETKSKSLELFMQKYKPKKGHIVTQDAKSEPKGKIETIPAFKYLLAMHTPKKE